MKSFQVKGRETEELKQLYDNLLQYWDTLKQYKARKYSSPSNNYSIKPIELQNNSPRYLMSMLQQDQEACMMMKITDVTTQEILRGRLEAIQSGKFKGQRLFAPMEEEGEEARSVSLCYSDDEYESSGSKEQEEHHCTSECCYSSSSSCDLFDASVEKDMVVKREEDRDNVVESVAETRVVANRGSYAVLFGALVFAFLLVALGMSGGCIDHDEVNFSSDMNYLHMIDSEGVYGNPNAKLSFDELGFFKF